MDAKPLRRRLRSSSWATCSKVRRSRSGLANGNSPSSTSSKLLIAFYMTLTTPITLVMLVRAALYRDRYHGRNQVPDSDPPKSTLIDKDRGRD